MPFEVLMEHVAALSPEDEQLPMGVLAERWGEPVARIGDAIDALKVLRGEPSYISVRGVAPAGGVTAGAGPGGGGASGGCHSGGAAGIGTAPGGNGNVVGGGGSGGSIFPR